jgi:K+-transporting ATPase ATPase C chain
LTFWFLPCISLEEENMLSHLRPAIIMLLLLTVLTGLIYPLAMLGIGQALAPGKANGSLIVTGDKVIGSSLIGQAWTSDKYFRGRPSAAGTGYDGNASSGSNLGPTSAKLMDRIKADIASLRQQGVTGTIPADAVTASGSGLDPDISPAFAQLQVQRIAAARNLPVAQITKLIADHKIEPQMGLVGEPRLNVLLLNMALDGVNSTGND